MQYAIALEDDVYQIFHDFKHGNTSEKHAVECLLQLYKPPHITNVNQLERLDIDNKPLKMQLLQSGLVKQSLDELADKTLYKVVLSESDDKFPRVNIYEDQLCNNYTITCKPAQSRAKALDLLSAMLKEAKNVLIYDTYLNANWKDTKQLFEYFPKKSLSIFFAFDLDQKTKTELKSMCSAWKILRDKRNTYSSHHDRYLLIDGQMEVLITSGIDYLFDKDKESTLMVRLKDNQ